MKNKLGDYAESRQEGLRLILLYLEKKTNSNQTHRCYYDPKHFKDFLSELIR